MADMQHHPNDHPASQNMLLPRTQYELPFMELIHKVQQIAIRSIEVRRRVYHVERPNYVWNLDGNHNLIKYHFLFMGAIDAYSRMVMYLTCIDNDRGSYVLSSFSKTVHENGLPTHVRSDLVGENVNVWRYMVEQHSSSSAIITGS